MGQSAELRKKSSVIIGQGVNRKRKKPSYLRKTAFLKVTPLRLELRTHRLRVCRPALLNRSKNLCFLLALAIYELLFIIQNLQL